MKIVGSRVIESELQMIEKKKEALSIQASNLFINRLRQLGYQNIRILKVDNNKLSNYAPFNGILKIESELFDKKLKKKISFELNVKNDQTILPKDNDVIETIRNTREEGIDFNVEDKFFDVDLSRFEVEDVEGDSYAIKHSDLGTIGYVFKNEYKKENLPKIETRFKKLALECVKQSNLEPKFTGEFQLPEPIKKESIVQTVSVEEEEEKEVDKEDDKEEEYKLLSKNENVIQKLKEKEQKKLEEEKAFLVNSIESKIINKLSKEIPGIKFTKPSYAELKKEGGKWSGKLVCFAELIFDNDIKNVEIDVIVKNSEPTFSVEAIEKKAEIAIGKKAEFYEKFKKEAMQENLNVEKNYIEQEQELNNIIEGKKSTIKKKADSITSIPIPGLPTTVTIPKTYLPESTKVGDILSLSGQRFRVVDDSANKLSTHGTGLFWTLELITGVVDVPEKAKKIDL